MASGVCVTSLRMLMRRTTADFTHYNRRSTGLRIMPLATVSVVSTLKPQPYEFVQMLFFFLFFLFVEQVYSQIYHMYDMWVGVFRFYPRTRTL